MMGHKICFYGKIWITIPKLSLLILVTWSTAETSTEVYANINAADIVKAIHVCMTL